MKFLPFFLCCLLLAGCAAQSVPAGATVPAQASAAPTTAQTVPVTIVQETEPTETIPIDLVRQMISDMSLEQRVGQLFLARCNQETASADVNTYHLGGLFCSERTLRARRWIP